MSETDELQPSSDFEIPLADSPEAEAPNTPEAEAPETPEAEAPKKKGSNPYVPGQPLPRLWKTEPDPEEESKESLEDSNKKKMKGSKDKDGAAAASKAPSKSKPLSRPAKPKPKKKPEGEDGQKRVLLEETPALDTIESRQRARIAMGALMVFCFAIFGWIIWGMLFGGSGDLMVDAVEMPPETIVALPGPPPSREPEARYMIDRARDHAKAGHGDQAVAMLKRVVSVYRGTQAAGEAQAALDRLSQNLPLFPDRPYLLAQKSAGEGTSPRSTAAPGSAATPESVRAPGAASPAPVTRPDSRSLPPPEVAASGPPPAPAPGPTKAVTPSPSLNPGTVGAPTTTTPAMNPNVAQTAPPPAPNSPATNGGPPPPAPAPGPGPETVARAPDQPQPQPTPPGPGEAAILVPANPAPPVAMPTAGENSNPAVDRGTPASPGRVARTLPPGFKAKPEAGLHESGWPFVIVGERDGGAMVLVPGGTFTMGSDSGDPSNRPAHSVRLSTYYIDQHEVTNRQFRAFLEDSHYRGHPPGKWLTDEKQRSLPDAAPAVFVSYQDAEEYAIWAQKRLPTEAQWEFAARSLDGRRYPWGDLPARWSRPRKFQQIDLVMSYSEDVSPYGVHDLAGNAMEWVRDWYDPRYFDRMRDKTTEDPTGPTTKRQGILRVVKGCSKDWLVFARQGVDSDRRSPSIGFRCSLAVEGGEASAVIAPHPAKPATPQPGTPPPGGQAPGGTVPF